MKTIKLVEQYGDRKPLFSQKTLGRAVAAGSEGVRLRKTKQNTAKPKYYSPSDAITIASSCSPLFFTVTSALFCGPDSVKGRPVSLILSFFVSTTQVV